MSDIRFLKWLGQSKTTTTTMPSGKIAYVMITAPNFKVGVSPSKKVVFICFNESHLKMIKNAFYFMLKALSVLKVVKFLSNFKIMTSQTEHKLITIYILPNIPKSKRDQKMKFSRLIEFNMRNIFLGKSYSKCGGDASPDPFMQNQN